MDPVVLLTLTPGLLDYLKFVVETHVRSGVPPEELGVAASVWSRLHSAQVIQPEARDDNGPETVHIPGPLSLSVDGDVKT